MPEKPFSEIDVQTLARKLASGEAFILLDVREPWELDAAHLTDSRLEVTPMSRLAREGTAALADRAQARDANIFVICHHGVRSADVTAWLAGQGWTYVVNVRGGIAAYAEQVDPSVGSY
jgi:rhodanese-related sulfurtransferase